MYCSSCILQRSKPCRKVVSSQLLFAAILRQKPRICGNLEGSWSLLSRAEAQVHLYVSAMQDLLFLQPVPATEKSIRLILHLKTNTVALPGNGAKNLIGKE